jgi:hypothetical protein
VDNKESEKSGLGIELHEPEHRCSESVLASGVFLWGVRGGLGGGSCSTGTVLRVLQLECDVLKT